MEFAVIQMTSQDDVLANLDAARRLLADAAGQGARLAVLPPLNWYLPAMKSAVLMFCVDATMPPTLTCAVGVNSTPFWLTRKT